jgi:uncharacterized protein YkwD
MATKPRKPRTTDAERKRQDEAHAANNASVETSMNQWRALQGLPPLDRKEKADGN